MSGGALIKFSFALILVVLTVSKVSGQSENNSGARFLFYNAENLFDTSDDSLRDDNDFLPGGIMKWNNIRFMKKINAVYKVITASGGWDPPPLVGFCEIENKSVLYELIGSTYLDKYLWGIIHEESNDPRGIDVCLIYRKDVLNLICYRYLKPANIRAEEFRTRNVLYTKWQIAGDTLHLILNHWPSRRGGVLAGESLRNSISDMVKMIADSVSESQRGKVKIIIAGDFNCTPEDIEILKFSDNSRTDKLQASSVFINLSGSLSDKGLGTYRYRGVWEMLDQVIVSDWLLKCESGFFADKSSFKVFQPGFLLRRDPVYPGLSPYPTYSGYRYQGGFSDHLPVILDLKQK
jgi:hypothetical protein